MHCDSIVNPPIRKRDERSEIHLAGIVERGVDLVLQGTDAAAEVGAVKFVLAARLEQRVGDGERGDHRDAVGAHHLAAVAELFHLLAKIAGGGHQGLAFVGGAGDEIFFFEYLNGDRRVLTAHASLSIALRRNNIISVCARARSFLCCSLARSLTNVVCCWRSRRFSSLSRRQVRISSSRRCSSPRISVSVMRLFLSVLMGHQYRAASECGQWRWLWEFAGPC